MKLEADRDNCRVLGLVTGCLLGLVAVVAVLTMTACDIVRKPAEVGVMATSQATRRILEVGFSGGSELDMFKLGAPGRLAGLSVAFNANQSATNTFVLYRVRDGRSSLVFTTAFVNNVYVDFGDLVWLKSYDVLAFTNSVTNAVSAAFSME